MDNSRESSAADRSGHTADDSLFRELVDHANDLFVVVGGSGRIEFVNQSFCRLTGIERDKFLGERIGVLFTGSARQNAQTRLTWALQSGGQGSVSLPLRTNSGESVEISFRPSAERTDEGMIRRMVLVGQSPFLYGDLAEQFNSLNRDLKTYSTQLERLNAELEARIQERTARLTALLHVSASLNAELQLDSLFELILRQAIETIAGASAGALLLYKPQIDRLVVQAACGYENSSIILDLQHEMERVNPQSIFADRTARVWGGESRTKTGHMRHLVRHVDQFRIRAAISAPIATPTERLGVLLLHNFDEPKAFSDDDVALAASLAGSAAIAITNARLYDETRTQAERLKLVNRLSSSVRDSLDLEQTLDLATEGLSLGVGASRAAITLFDESVESAVYAAEYSEPGIKNLKDRQSLLIGTPFFREVLGFRATRAIHEARVDPRVAEMRKEIAELGIESILVVPLVVRDRFIGMVELHQCDQLRDWREDDIGLAEAVAKQVATAVHQVRLHGKLRESVREAQALYRAAGILINTSDLDALLDQILTAIDEEFNLPRAAILLPDAEGKVLYLRATHGHPDSVAGKLIPLDGPGIVPHAARMRETVNVPDVSVDARYVDDWGDCRSELCIPLILDGAFIGVLDLQSRRVNAFTERDLRILASFADRAAIAIGQARLFQQVSRAKREWEATFDAMSDAVFMFDATKRLARMNSAASQLESHTFAELTGKPCCEILADVEKHECVVDRAMSSCERLTAEWTRGEHSFSITVDPVVGDEGKAAGAVAVVRDLSLLRRAEQRAAQADKLRALGQLASGVAHDFNNMLAAILGRAQLLAEETSDEHVLAGLDVIEKAALDGSATVKRIQTFAHQRTDAEFVTTDAATLVRDAIEITRTRWRNDAQSKGVRYDIEFEPDGPFCVLADESELREVFVNLVINALDAMPDGGRLDIAITRVGDDVQISFVDNGSGMAEEVRARIFEPFFTTKGPAGTGLGLAVSYSILSRHHGRIDARSEPGTGTTIVVTIPAADDVRPSEPAVVTSTPRRARILVIDDEQPVRDVLSDMLRTHGNSVEAVPGGAEGLAALESEEFDVVFTDLSMPEMDGWAVAREVKLRRPAARVVLVTGYAATIDPSDEDRRCVDGIIAKPFDRERVMRALQSVLMDVEVEDTALS